MSESNSGEPSEPTIQASNVRPPVEPTEALVAGAGERKGVDLMFVPPAAPITEPTPMPVNLAPAGAADAPSPPPAAPQAATAPASESSE